jgi:SAM-dependent methyltransferase
MIVIKKLFRSLKEHGVRITLREIIDRLNIGLRVFFDRSFDRRFGVETSGIIDIEEYPDVGLEQKSAGYRYEPTPAPALKFMLKKLDIDHSKYTFIDFGSGKGRVLLIASEYPYRKIIGVEFSQALHDIAKSNLNAWKYPTQKCFNIESICMDARNFKLPNDPVVLFFFTPFKNSITAEVVSNIQKSIKNEPRHIEILYYGTNQEFIDVLRKLNLNCREIYGYRPFSARKKYKGVLFNSKN